MRLKQIRTQLGLTQQELADKIDCSPTVYARYEREEREPSIDMLIKLSDVLDVSVDYLIGKPDDFPRLSQYQKALITASAKADERAQEDALNILLSHQYDIDD